MMTAMRFSIVTPSFRSSRWLKLCIASVADQGCELEHIVQDSCSDDDTQTWLPKDPRVTAVIEKDSGMYDAVNRGLRRASGDLVAYLNCDEQYLPGALAKVRDFFDSHPDVEVVFGDCMVVGPQGEYLCERRSLTPQFLHTMVSGNLSFLTAGAFARESVFSERQLWFDPTLRAVGDGKWAVQLIKAGVRMAALGSFTSVFTETGSNLMLDTRSTEESRKFSSAAPAWARRLAPLIIAHYRWRRWRAGYYKARQLDYAIYTQDSPGARKTFRVENPTARWNRRHEAPAA